MYRLCTEGGGGGGGMFNLQYMGLFSHYTGEEKIFTFPLLKIFVQKDLKFANANFSGEICFGLDN